MGDVCIVNDGNEFPADIILLNTSSENSEAYVETSNLDGEKALKVKEAIKGGDMLIKW